MKRQVVIIKGYPNNENEKNRLEEYGKIYVEYFKSNTGGAYDETEIKDLTSPTVAEIKALLEKEQPDYAVLVLMGHGATQENKQLFKLNENEIVNPGQIELSAKKQLVIVESCRSLRANFPVVDITDKVPSYRDGGVLRFPLTRVKARRLYEGSIAACEEGTVVCFACDEDESASNFRFSKMLLEKGKVWGNSLSNVNVTLSITDLMEKVIAEFETIYQNNTKKQTPQIQGSIPFPFAVSKY